MLILKNVYSRTGDFSLADINLSVNDDEYFVLLGPNGSGKTSLLKCILGLSALEGGVLCLDGIDLAALPPEKRGIGYVPQNHLLFPAMSVFDNIAFGLRAKKIDRPSIAGKVGTIADMLHIGHLLGQRAATLSGGESQRVALARALVINPRLMLLDEPFSAVDYELKTSLWIECKDLIKQLGIPVIHITHNFEEAFFMAERLGIMIRGKIVQTGNREELSYSPAHEPVARFLGYRNIFSGTVISHNDVTELRTENFSVFTDKKITAPTAAFCIRPQDIKVIYDDAPVKPELSRNLYEVRIIKREADIDFYRLLVKFDGSKNYFDFELKFPAYIYQRLSLAGAERIRIGIWEPNIIFFSDPLVAPSTEQHHPSCRQTQQP